MPFSNITDEEMNQEIVEALVDTMLDDGEEWDVEFDEDRSKIILTIDDDVKEYSSYAAVLNDLEHTIYHTVYNYPFKDFDDTYLFYLSHEQLAYLGMEKEYQWRMSQPSNLVDPKLFEDPEESIDIAPENEQQLHETPKEVEEKAASTPIEVAHEDFKKDESLATETKKETRNNEKKSQKKTLPYRELAKQIDQRYPILEVIKEAGLHLERNSSTTYTTREHDSLIIHPDRNRFYWNSKGEMNGPVRLYQLLMQKDFMQTVETLSQRIGTLPLIDRPAEHAKKAKNVHEWNGALDAHKKLWQEMDRHQCQNSNLKETFAYLTKTRKIDPEIVQTFIDSGMLYQGKDAKGHPMAFFVGRNEFGLINSSCFRAVYSNSKFKGDLSGCDYERGWFFEPSKNLSVVNPQATPNSCKKMFDTSKMLLVFESQIEMMSYMTILKESGFNWRNYAYLSCGSINKNQCVDQTCALYGYKKVVMMFNNDRGKERNPGKEMAEQVQKRLLDQGLSADLHLPRDANDWNDTLVLRHQQKEKQAVISKTKNTSRER